MKIMFKKSVILLFVLAMSTACQKKEAPNELKQAILTNTDFKEVKDKAKEIIKKGFNAGDSYGEVWIRDFNTFITLSCELYDHKQIEENLLVFFRLQREDGNIVDGFIPKEKAEHTEGGYTYIYTDLEPNFCGHKNTVETDHETSLVQAVYKYIQATGNKNFLDQLVGDFTVRTRLGQAIDFLYEHRWADKYKMIYGATTADWGDVQHQHPWGVYITDETKYCLDIYDNAMLLIALEHMQELDPENRNRWKRKHEELATQTMKVLWDEENQKFIPHVYLDGSPYPEDFDENEIYYHGGTAVAIEAGLLSKEQIATSLKKMRDNVAKSGAGSIGLTMYPPYPDWAFENKGMYPYGYQNGGDWTWFGARMIIQLNRFGFVQEAYDNLLPMTDRVVANKGFYEWYTVDNKPEGSGTFKGSAGVLYEAITGLESWASK